jgi:hypothetical protein
LQQVAVLVALACVHPETGNNDDIVLNYSEYNAENHADIE